MNGATEYLGCDICERSCCRNATTTGLVVLADKLDDRVRATVTGLAQDAVESDERERSQWLLLTLTEQLAAGHGTTPGPDVAFADLVRGQWATTSDLDRFEEACLASESEWDPRTRSLTPDLPDRVAGYASSVTGNARFGRFWREISQRLTPEQNAVLRGWHVARAREVARATVTFPSWTP